MPKVVIVGAGISGLALAFRLHQLCRGIDITVLDQRDRPGGTVWTERRDGFAVEIGPNGFLDSKPSTLALARDVGLGEQLLGASESSGKNRYLFLGGKLRRLPNSFASFLCSPVLSWRGKASLLMERYRRARCGGSDESIDAFVRRRGGNEAADVLADALVTGIHAGDPALLSVRAAFPRLVEFEDRYGSVLKGMAGAARRRRAEAAAHGKAHQGVGKMWSFREGMRLLIEKICEKLPRPPLFGAQVRRIEKIPAAKPAWRVIADGQDHWPADAVVLTCPAYEQAQILGKLDSRLAGQIEAIAYNCVVVVAVAYRQEDVSIALDGFGFIAPQRTRRDILGVQWCSSIFPGRAPAGFVLLRVMCGGWNRPEIVAWDEARLLQAVRTEIQRSMGIRAEPVFHHIVRWERAIPQYHLGHLERIAAIERAVASHPGLFLGGNAYHGVALNDCTLQAELLAARLTDFLREP
jgi:protoporphyrinogen/coproporphyrinogen III oxidase